MDGTGIEADGLTKRFGERVAVDDVNLSIPPGSVYALLGPNGAGKTTTVRMLAGLLAPSSGSARVAGLPVRQDEGALSALHRRIGLLTEAPGVWERLSCASNLRVYAELHDLPDPAGAVERALRLVGLWERRADPAAKLSKGMRQRLALARALLHHPPVLFLDEPTSGLDPEAAAEVRALVAALRGEGRAILLCTHNLAEAERLADTVGVFRRSLLAEGRPHELRRAVLGAEVAARLRPPDRPERYVRLAERLPGVTSVRAEGEELLLSAACPEEVLPPLARALVEAGADLLALGERRRSLEDAYLAILDRADG